MTAGKIVFYGQMEKFSGEMVRASDNSALFIKINLLFPFTTGDKLYF